MDTKRTLENRTEIHKTRAQLEDCDAVSGNRCEASDNEGSYILDERDHLNSFTSD